MRSSYDICLCGSPNRKCIVANVLCRHVHLRSHGAAGVRTRLRQIQCGIKNAFLLAALGSVILGLSGCGGGIIVGTAAQAGSLSASPSIIAFGSVPVGQSASSTLTFRNMGSTTLQVTQMSVTGQAFSVSNISDLPISIGANGAYNINVSFSPEATGAVGGQLTITSNGSNSGTAMIGISGTGTAATAAATLGGLSCASSSITGAGTDNCTATLNTAAPSGGFAIGLSSNDDSVNVPASATVAAGSTSANFAVNVPAVSTPQTVTLTASAGGAVETFALQLNAAKQDSANPPVLSGINCGSSSMTAAGTDDCSITLSAAAPSGGFAVSVASSGASVVVPGSVTVEAGSASASFMANVSAVSTAQTVTLTASAGGAEEAFALQLSASGQPVASTPVLSGLGCGNPSMTGAGTENCTVTLNAAAPDGGIAVSVASNNTAVTVPTSVTVSGGSTSTSFTATVSAVATAQTVTLVASTAGVEEAFDLQLSASSQVGKSAPTLSGLNCDSSSMTGAGTDHCTITLSATAPSGGFAVSAGSNSAAVTLPPSVIVATGSASASFTAYVSAVSAAQAVTLTASAGGVVEDFAVQLNAANRDGPSAATLSGLNCFRSSMTGAGTDRCTITLDAAAPSGGFAVSLGSTSGAVTVPASMTVAAGSTSADFNANISAVSTAQTVTLTASAGNAVETFSLQLNAASRNDPSAPALSGLGCSLSSMTGAGTDRCTITLNTAAPSGGFAVSLSSNGDAVTVPASVTVAAGATSASFIANISAVATVQTVILTASADGVGEAFDLQLSASSQPGASAPVLSGLSCGLSSMTGAGTDNCTVALSAAAPGGGFAVSLGSNNAAVALPATAIVAAGSTSASFTATVSAVTTAQTVTLTASAGGVAEAFDLQLSTASQGGTSGPLLDINATNITFGDVSVNTPATQSVTLTSTGTAAVAVSAATVTGSGFTLSGATFPLTLNLNQTVTLSIEFDPTVQGAATGTLTVVSTSLTSPTATVGLSGTGEAGTAGTGQVDLTWNAPTNSPDPVAGYNVYRSPSGAYSFVPLNSSVLTQTTYIDSTAENGQAYDYIVESVDANGLSSAPTNIATLTLP